MQRRSLGHSCLWHARQRSQCGVPPLLLLQETPSKSPQRLGSVSERKSVRNTCWQQGHRGVEERVAMAREAGHQTRTLSQAELNGERTKFVFCDCLSTCVSTPLTIEVMQLAKQRKFKTPPFCFRETVLQNSRFCLWYHQACQCVYFVPRPVRVCVCVSVRCWRAS